MKINKFLFLFFVSSFVIFTTGFCAEQDDYICINKKNVLHKFVHFDQPTDHFTMNVFANWENETFDIFDQVKDPQGIAIDLGAWIGTTAIWLSNNFYHVIAVDADPVSLQCLTMNLQASNCANVSICPKPIAQIGNRVIFGPRGNVLNESISYIKDKSTCPSQNDHEMQALTLKQLIYDYIFTNEKIKNHPISFIKCDIEGGEENILEDILYFAFHNKCKAYISFHLDWWKSKKITDFEYLFTFFKTNCSDQNICEYIKKHPFSSLLFEPLKTGNPLIKKNMPAIIIGYNQFTYIKNMIEQLEKFTNDIIVIDNNSSYKPLLDYYENDFKYTLLRQKTNGGHTIYTDRYIQNLVGDFYILTDPDLEFNSKLPANFIQVLIDVSHHFGAHRVGLALCVDSPDIRTDIQFHGHTIKEWESQFWKHPLSYPDNPTLQLYDAAIDTTFCLINKRPKNQLHIRIAGDYTCFHLPWHKDFKSKLQNGEYETYTQNNVSSCWLKKD